MDTSQNNSLDVVCSGSGTSGFVNLSLGENGKSFRFYRCGVCGGYFPSTPLKEHHRIENRGNR